MDTETLNTDTKDGRVMWIQKQGVLYIGWSGDAGTETLCKGWPGDAGTETLCKGWPGDADTETLNTGLFMVQRMAG